MTLGQQIELGPFNMPVIRLLILAGLGRLVARGEGLPGGRLPLDNAMIVFGAVALLMAPFHSDPFGQVIGNGGQAFNAVGTYFLVRVWCTSVHSVVGVIRVVAIVLLPVAVEMAQETISGRNVFSSLGGVAEFAEVREGRVRAQGPFAHAILAGTVGGVCLPLFIGLRRFGGVTASIGVGAALVMVGTSASSGPIGSLVAGGAALVAWKRRFSMHVLRRGAVASYVLLDLVMKAPPYFLIARIDVIGGSTGYHRAELIRSALEHFGEWWLWGTDYTRHWMVTGVSWSPDHTDITNQYLQLGVIGGLPLMLTFIWVLTRAFSAVGTVIRAPVPSNLSFMAWALGAALFAHAVSCISVAYFDQSFVFLYLTLGLIGAMHVQALAPGGSAPAPERTGGARASVRRQQVAPLRSARAQQARSKQKVGEAS